MYKAHLPFEVIQMNNVLLFTEKRKLMEMCPLTTTGTFLLFKSERLFVKFLNGYVWGGGVYRHQKIHTVKHGGGSIIAALNLLLNLLNPRALKE